jgi:hypothetical protein
MRGWMWPWAAVYFLQVAIGTANWNQLDPRGNGWAGAAMGAVFLIPTIALWRSRSTFQQPA